MNRQWFFHLFVPIITHEPLYGVFQALGTSQEAKFVENFR